MNSAKLVANIYKHDRTLNRLIWANKMSNKSCLSHFHTTVRMITIFSTKSENTHWIDLMEMFTKVICLEIGVAENSNTVLKKMHTHWDIKAMGYIRLKMKSVSERQQLTVHTG